ncbi:hypothetical protein GCM10010094_57970 [Streptomyces flaveus]|uniref:Uncharacterized protein n=1 Tax=Streptomyces flaveus TaxID=66370 RepID=A0A917R4Q6_9ACTN|nr:hypothetical protein GCM10010094_57970 [Streptomyces flaveus]
MQSVLFGECGTPAVPRPYLHGHPGRGREPPPGGGEPPLQRTLCGHVNPRIRQPSAGRRVRVDRELTGERVGGALAVFQGAERL